MNAQHDPIEVFSEEQAVRLTGVSRRQLQNWAKSGFFKPSFMANVTGIPLYTFRDLACLKVLYALRKKVSLQELKRAKMRLMHLGDHFWTATTLIVFNKRVAFKDPSTGEFEEANTGQRIFKVVLAVVESDIKQAVIDLQQRKSFGGIARSRAVMRNQPVIAGTRVPVRAIKSFHDAGYSSDQIIKEYPSLTLQDVESAIRFKDQSISDAA